MEDSILRRLLPIFRDVLDDATITITRASNADTIRGYDSLAHIDVIAAIEAEFELSFDFLELVRLNEVGDMVELIALKQKAVA